MISLYNTFVFVYRQAARLAAVRSTKAKAWVEGRKNLFEKLHRQLTINTHPIIWVHSASTGEFEQAKPVIEALKQQFPRYKILATFFSPSGFNAAEKYTHIDYRYYLPVDTAANAQRFVSVVKPHLVIFSKYDFWHHHLKAIQDAGIPLILISSIFRPGQLFFRWYGGFYRALLQRFTHIFVQDETSLQLLQKAGIQHCSIGGDTRFDRVIAITHNSKDIGLVKEFAGTAPVLVAGSTWPGDEALLKQLDGDLKQIIAPHEITVPHIAELQKAFPKNILFSEAEKIGPQNAATQVLIINNVGMLSRLYQYGTLTYVGGGFTKSGIHNTLEAAVWGKPVIIGPNYHKFREAKGLIAAGGGFVVSNAAQLQQKVQELLHNKAALEAASTAARNYVLQNAGATRRIMEYLQNVLGRN